MKDDAAWVQQLLSDDAAQGFSLEPEDRARFERILGHLPAEDLGECELCGKPLALGQFVNQYDDVGTAHANCEAPFAKPQEETPAPFGDGSTMPIYVLLGVPALLESIAQTPPSGGRE